MYKKRSGATAWHLRSKRGTGYFFRCGLFPGGGFGTARKGVSGWRGLGVVEALGNLICRTTAAVLLVWSAFGVCVLCAFAHEALTLSLSLLVEKEKRKKKPLLLCPVLLRVPFCSKRAVLRLREKGQTLGKDQKEGSRFVPRP